MTRIGVFIGLLTALAGSAQAMQESVEIRIAGRRSVLESVRLAEKTTDCHAVIAFTGVPTAEQRGELAVLGVELHQYLEGFAYFATVPGGSGTELLALPFVRAGEPFRAEWKGPLALDALAHLSEDVRLRLAVYGFPDTEYDSLRWAVESLGGLVESPEFRLQRRVVVSITPGVLPALLESDEVRWCEPFDLPRHALNQDSAAFCSVPEARAAPFGLTGSGVRVGIMDADRVQSNHQDFGTRITIVDSNTNVADFHATHVTGTILGSGFGNSAAMGMAPSALGYMWTYEVSDPIGRKETGFPTHSIDVDNNSWGVIEGWEFNGFWGWFYVVNSTGFGTYTAQIGDLDGLIQDSGTLVSFASGNDWDQGSGGVAYYYAYYGHKHLNAVTGTFSSSWYYDYHLPDYGADYYGCILEHGTLKNGLCVGSIDDSGFPSLFSNNGPTVDGRMKPDLVAVGEDVLSTVPTNSYASTQGTSMATPAVSGIAALLVEGWRNAHSGADPRLDVLKGLLLHSTFDLGNPGPDYNMGFGAVDAGYAAYTIYFESPTAPSHRTGVVANGQTKEFLVDVPAGRSLFWATLCWTDVPGNPAAPKALVNDLDLTLVSPSGQTHSPWRLNPSSPGSNATRGVNTLDNVERADLPLPQAGTWKVRVKGTLIPGGPQSFAVWFSEPYLNLAPQVDAGPDVDLAATGPAGRSITLSAIGVSDPNGPEDIASYSWDTDGDGDFDDPGGSAQGPMAIATFPVGSRTVSLRVTDSFGLSGVDSLQVSIRNTPPVAGIAGGDVRRATDPQGADVLLDGSASTDAQTNLDIVSYEWDLDGDSSHDDATGETVAVRLALGNNAIGLRVTDSKGASATTAKIITVVDAENLLRLGGSFKGSISQAGDRDSFFLEAVEGSLLRVSLKARFWHRLGVFGPEGVTVSEVLSPIETKGTKVDNTLPTTGWYWIEVEGGNGSSLGPYKLSMKVVPPRVVGRVDDLLSVQTPVKDYSIEILAGAKVVAKVKGTKFGGALGDPSLSILDPDGATVASTTAGGTVTLGSAARTGIYVIRVQSVDGSAGFGGYHLSWKASGPKGREKISEVE